MQRVLVSGLFFLSGISGLVYQVCWVRQFGYVFGNTVYSAALVTALFMCGLGIGGYLAGAWSDRGFARSENVLLARYGACELAIGILGALLALTLPTLGAALASLSQYSKGDHGWHYLSVASEALRYGAVVVALAPITVLMGATLTLLVRATVAHDLGAVGWRVAVIYGLNTAGAALGAWLTDFALVPQVGLLRSQLGAAMLNGLVGTCALVWSWRRRRGGPADTSEASSIGGRSAVGAARGVVLKVATALFLTGFVGMGLEIFWFQFITSMLGGYRTVFSTLLAVILAGLFLGAIASGHLSRSRAQPARMLMLAEALLVVSALVLVAACAPGWVDDVLQGAVPAGGGRPSLPAQHWAVLQVVLFVAGLPSLLMGVAFPLGNACAQRAEEAVGRCTGALYLANTLGAVAGSLVAGFVLIPRLGSQATLGVLAGAAALSLVPLYSIVASESRAAGRRALVQSAGLAALAMGAWALLPADFILQKNLFRVPGLVLAADEGADGPIAVTSERDGKLRLVTNGHPMSMGNPSQWISTRYMRALAHVPLLLHPDPRRALVICFGVGNTLHAATLHSRLERIDLVDISKRVLEKAPYFRALHGGALEDSRVGVFVNDGRHHLRISSAESYDVITLEPPPISHAGVASLYSREFYDLALSRLRKGGFLAQWLPIYQVDAPVALSMVRAFVDAFPDAVLLSGSGRELILLGRKGGPVRLEPGAVESRLTEEPGAKHDLEMVNLGQMLTLAGMFVADAQTLKRASVAAEPLTDDKPTNEYGSASRLEWHSQPRELFALERVREYCPACFDGERETVVGLGAYLKRMSTMFAQRAAAAEAGPLPEHMTGTGP